MRLLTWAELAQQLKKNATHQESFESSNDLFLSEYAASIMEPNLGKIEISSVQGIGNYTIKKTKAHLSQDLEMEMKLDEPLFTVGCLFSGSFVFHNGDVEKGIKVESPTIVMYRQKENLSYQRIDCSRPYITLNISFNDQVLKRILQKFNDSASILARLDRHDMIAAKPEDQFLGALFNKLDLLPLDKDVHNLFLAESLVLRILNKAMMVLSQKDGDRIILPETETTENNQAKRFYEVLKYLEANLHKNISVDKVAKHFEVNARWVQRRFKEELHTSFSDYLRDLRLQRAYDLLSEGGDDISVKKVALEVGYFSSQSFSTNFKKRYNISPGQLLNA